MTANRRRKPFVATRKADRLIFNVRLRPEPDCDDAARALKALIKGALRTLRLRCVGLTVQQAEKPAAALPAPSVPEEAKTNER